MIISITDSFFVLLFLNIFIGSISLFASS